MRKALVVGGNSGIGLALALRMLKKGYDHIYIMGKDAPKTADIPVQEQARFEEKTSFSRVNFVDEDYRVLHSITDIDTLIITAGFGRVALFDDLTEVEITNLIKCNLLAAIRIVKHYYTQIKGKRDFYCAVMGSIAGHVSSPFFSVYSAAKSGLCRFIENVNIELVKAGSPNRILDVSPGSIKGTNFNGTGNQPALLVDLAEEILMRTFNRDTLYIPQYEETYSGVLQRYKNDPARYGLESYDYKANSGRISNNPQVIVGYLSGTFDLFHIGHLNLLKRAKEQCDYLIVGVHKSGSWKGKETYIPFEERVKIVESIQYVDRAIESYTEDSDAYDALHFDKLFVGSDYKGSERFARYEEYFKDKGVEIVYFPYTKGTSSTQLRAAIAK